MKVLSFVVRVECPSCEGKRCVASTASTFGAACPECDGDGSVEDLIPYEDFAKLLDGLVKR